jgi:hypothetical protein
VGGPREDCVEITDAVVAAARLAIVAELEAHGATKRIPDFVHVWHRLVTVQDEQRRDDVAGSVG